MISQRNNSKVIKPQGSQSIQREESIFHPAECDLTLG